MFADLEPSRLAAAYRTARAELLDARVSAGHWVGELSSSALSTATAISALTLAERGRSAPGPAAAVAGDMTGEAAAGRDGMQEGTSQDGEAAGAPAAHEVARLIAGGIDWLTRRQNQDGGWGDTDKSYSNISTTMLVMAAFHLAGVFERHAALMERASQYVDSQGGVAGLRRRYGKDKTFAVPILANCAMAGMVPWRQVSALPFELACLPQALYRFLRLPVVSYAIPALVAIGQARYVHQPPRNPLTRFLRALAIKPSLRVLEAIQPASGGYLEAIPLTSFVVMSLAANGRSRHPVAQRGIQFLLGSVRDDGSWPIDTNLATWNTTLAVNSLAGAGENVTSLECLDWVLGCQQRERHPFTGAAPGGWGWSDLSGAVPDADDTPSALLALAAWRDAAADTQAADDRLDTAARHGIGWLLDLQNRDGGWPTFCRGWGALPFDRSGADLTAHALRAIHAWQTLGTSTGQLSAADDRRLPRRLRGAVERGFRYLADQQAGDGCWIPLWFGNQDHPREENPIYGTAKVLLAYRDLGRTASIEAQRGLQWLRGAQNEDGGWGGGPSVAGPSVAGPSVAGAAVEPEGKVFIESSVEETALAVEALLMDVSDDAAREAVARGLHWLVDAVESGRYLENWPIGFYFAKLWYHEKLYPLIFTVSALGRAQAWSNQPTPPATPPAHLTC